MFIKLARRLGYLVYHAIMSSDIAKEKIIKPLEEASGWGEDDEKNVGEIIKEIEKTVSSKRTMQEKIKIIENAASSKK
jgi:Na+/H+ antiporter NhaB